MIIEKLMNCMLLRVLSDIKMLKFNSWKCIQRLMLNGDLFKYCLSLKS